MSSGQAAVGQLTRDRLKREAREARAERHGGRERAGPTACPTEPPPPGKLRPEPDYLRAARGAVGAVVSRSESAFGALRIRTARLN